MYSTIEVMKKIGFYFIVLLITSSCCALSFVDNITGGGMPDSGSDGAKFYKKVCGRCHNAVHPSTRTSDKWGLVLRRVELIGEHMPMPPLTEEESEEILGYLTKYSKDSLRNK